MASTITKVGLRGVSQQARPILTLLSSRQLSRNSHQEALAETRRREPGQAENLMEIGTRKVFTDKHDTFRSSVRRFLQDEIFPNQMRFEEQGFVDREIWEQMGAAGFLGVASPVEMGGVGADIKSAVIVSEEQGYANDCGTAGWKTHSDMVMPYIENYGTPEQQQKYIPRMTAGKIIGSIAMTEPQAGSDLQGIKTMAKKDGDDWVLNGSKVFITNGVMCDVAIVVALTDLNAKKKAHGISLFLVDANLPGFTKGKPLKKLGHHGMDTAELFFDDVRLPKEALLGGEEQQNNGFYFLMNVLSRERLILSVGIQAHTEYIFEMTRQHVKKRKTSNLQTVQHRLAEMKTEICVSRAFTDQCIQLISENRLDRATASMLKLKTSTVANKVSGECLQLHGDLGYLAEQPIARAYTTTKAYPIYAGSNEIMKELIARDICKDV